MTIATKNVEILTSLTEDPYVSFFPWKLDVHDTASGMAKSIDPRGLLSEILTDEEWAAYPGNKTTDAKWTNPDCRAIPGTGVHRD